jgi:putative oxidoreductase
VSALRRPWLHRLLGLVLGATFVYASYDKIWNLADFARIVYHYRLVGPSQLLPPLLPNLLAFTLPWVEALAGLLLLVGLWRREAALLTGGLLVVFVVAVGLALARGIDLENCGCFSVSGGGRAAGLKLILQDLGLLAVAGVLAFLPPRDQASVRPAPNPAVRA